MRKEQEFSKLIRKYLSGLANEEEKKEIEQWYESFDAQKADVDEGEIEMALENGLRELSDRFTRRRRFKVLLKKVSVAAAILCFVAGYFFINRTLTGHDAMKDIVEQQDVDPGKNYATLTLSNGKKIKLDDMDEGPLSQQGNIHVIKSEDGLVAYIDEEDEDRHAEESGYNTISTPRGGKYKVVLSDGSMVWLNSESSITFPVAFKGETREVEVEGEVYFDVFRDEKKSFIVKNKDLRLKVLGTEFNVMAYVDEPETKVTLVSGSLLVRKEFTNERVQLRPGEQVRVKEGERMRKLENVEIREAIAWKNDLFWFDDSDIYSIMRQLGRWYDVDIKIEEGMEERFTGSIPKDIKFSKVFGFLQKTGDIRYEIKNNRELTVMKK